jgi:RNA polymerase sigma-70 factor (ECF subfamily)
LKRQREDPQQWNDKVRALDRRMIRRAIWQKTRTVHGADDLVQDVYVELMALEESRRPDVRNVKAFAHGVARNIARDELRKLARSRIDPDRQVEDLEIDSGDSDPAERYDNDRRREQISKEIGRLPPRRARVLTLALEGYKLHEIAEQLGMKSRTAAKHLELAVRDLLKRLTRKPTADGALRSPGRTQKRGPCHG